MKRYFNIVKTLLKIANKKKIMVFYMFLSCGLYNLASLLPPIATSGIIGVITTNNFNGIWLYVSLYFFFYLLYFSNLHWNYYTYTVLADYYHIEVQKKLFDHITNNSSIIEKTSKGKIVDTCSEDIKYLVDVMDAASEALMRFIELIIIIFVFAYYNIVTAIVVAVLDILYIKIMNDNSKIIAKHYEGIRKYEDKIIDMLNQMMSSLTQIKSLNIMPNINKNLDKSRKKWSYAYNQKRLEETSRYCTIPYIVYIGKIILYIFLAYLVINEKMTLDKLVLLISYFEMTISCTDQMLDYCLNLSNYGIRINRIDNILSYTNTSSMDFGEINNDYINGVVVFDNVYYDIKNKEVLKNVSFKIYPNEINAIIGHSGSGKTTIANLLYRLDRVKSGSILIDNENIYNYTKNVYSSNISGVFQKPLIFDMTIRENFSLSDKNKDNQIEVCKRLGIHEFITNLPNGYNTKISDDDKLISDGKKQLIAIARAVLTKSEILVFDEPTSNIDPVSTTEIRDVLIDLKKDHTIILITHKPEMMEIADRVIVMNKGRVVAKGKNGEVLEKNNIYKDLKNRSFASVSSIIEK